MSDAVLRKALIRLAHEHPEFRADILPLVKTAAPASNGGFPPDTIGETKPGGSAEGVKGKGEDGPTISDADKPWMGGEFTQQENVELADKQEGGILGDGKVDDAPMKVASDEKALRARLIRLAHEHPDFRADILPLVTAASESSALPDDSPKSKNQNKPETYYGGKPKIDEPAPAAKQAAEERKALIRMAAELPEFRADILAMIK